MTEQKDKKKYWYATTVYRCPLCWKERTYKGRVYDEKKKGFEIKRMDVKMESLETTGEKLIMVRISNSEWIQLIPQALFAEVIKKASEMIAEKVVSEQQNDILAKVSQDAIATLVVAESGNAIKDMLDKKLPDKIERVVEKQVEVYQRGILGGVTRIK
jgi:hypothetical protein